MPSAALAFAFAATVAGGALNGTIQSGRPSALQSSVSSAPESPLACDREALTDRERTRHFDELGPALRKLRRSVRSLPDGYEFEFAGDRATYAMLSEWVEGERVCCPFFDIALRSDREGGAVHLRLTGRPGVRRFIEVDGKAWIEASGTK